MSLGRSIVKRLVRGYKTLNTEERRIHVIREIETQENVAQRPREFIQNPVNIKTEQKPVEIVQNTIVFQIPISDAIEIPKVPTKVEKILSIRSDIEPEKNLVLSYPLIPLKPTKDETILAYTRIAWNEKTNRFIYQLTEPPLTDKIKKILEKTKELLEQRLDIDFSKLKKPEASDYLKKEIDEIVKYFGFLTTGEEKKALNYYIERDFMGLGKIEPLMKDPDIEDISCDGIGIPIFVFHRNPDIGSVITNISFDNSDELDSFASKLAQMCGKSISISEPLLDGMLPDGSRLQLTLATDIARRGSNFSIRKFTEEPLTPVHMLNFGTTDVKTLAYLWFLIEKGLSILISGGTASGKTSLLNVLSLFIQPEKKIISIEDTGELKLPHSHWVPSVARITISEEGKPGNVDLFDLLKASLRQRPDYTIVGEVRGKEAYILFQQMATGHPSMATIHAENMEKLMDRLTTQPIALSPNLINSVDLVIFLSRMNYKNKFVRRITKVVEITGYDQKTNSPIVNVVYKWDPIKDRFEVVGNSLLLRKIVEMTGISEKDIKREIETRMIVLTWLQKHNISNYMDIYKVFSLYYKDSQRLFSVIEGEFQ